MKEIIRETAEKFEKLLENEMINYTRFNIYDGYKYIFSAFPYADVVIHSGSYHYWEGHVESMGFPWDEGDVTHCTPEHMVGLMTGKCTTEDFNFDYSTEDFINSLENIMGI